MQHLTYFQVGYHYLKGTQEGSPLAPLWWSGHRRCSRLTRFPLFCLPRTWKWPVLFPRNWGRSARSVGCWDTWSGSARWWRCDRCSVAPVFWIIWRCELTGDGQTDGDFPLADGQMFSLLWLLLLFCLLVFCRYKQWKVVDWPVCKNNSVFGGGIAELPPIQ